MEKIILTSLIALPIALTLGVIFSLIIQYKPEVIIEKKLKLLTSKFISDKKFIFSLFVSIIITYTYVTFLISNQFGIFSIFLGFLLSSLLYLSIYDIYFLGIPTKFLYNFLISIVLINFIALIINFINYRSQGEMLIDPTFQIGTLSNLAGGILLSGITFLLRYLTKKKGIGEGDIEVMLGVGLSIGLVNSVLSVLIGNIIGIFLGIIYFILSKKDFKNTMIPYVPFISLGVALTILFNDEILLLLGLR